MAGRQLNFSTAQKTLAGPLDQGAVKQPPEQQASETDLSILIRPAVQLLAGCLFQIIDDQSEQKNFFVTSAQGFAADGILYARPV